MNGGSTRSHKVDYSSLAHHHPEQAHSTVLRARRRVQFEFKINLKKVRHASPRYRMAKIVNEPRLRQQLILAHHIERVLAEGKAKDYGQIAGWLHISHSRLIQIVNLTLLAPDIQNDILLSNEKRINNLPEYKTREITDEFDWDKQRVLWQTLIGG